MCVLCEKVVRYSNMLKITLRGKHLCRIIISNKKGEIEFYVEPSLEKIILASRQCVLCQRQEQCAICMGEKGEIGKSLRLDCGHVFDSDCIMTWLKKCGTCPICRSKIVL